MKYIRLIIICIALLLWTPLTSTARIMPASATMTPVEQAVSSSAAECVREAHSCTYLPMMRKPVPLPGQAPQPVTGICAQNQPELAEGAQAWVTDPTPAQHSEETACARLYLKGVPWVGYEITFTVQYSSRTETYTAVTDAQGVAATTFNIGAAPVGEPVVVEARFPTGARVSTTFTPE
jgi:hypothetical protein